MELEVGPYGFLGLGATAESMALGSTLFGMSRGLGIGVDAEQVVELRRAGVAAQLADVSRLALAGDSVSLVVIDHILEQLADAEEVRDALAEARRVARNFLYIQGPFYDQDPYLADLGLKPYWSDRSRNRCHLTSHLLRLLLAEVGLTEVVMMARRRIGDSGDAVIHPLASPPNQYDYDPHQHSPKPSVVFDRPIYEELLCFVKLGSVRGWKGTLEQVRDLRDAEVIEPEVEREPLRSPARRRSRLREVERRLLLERRRQFLAYLHLRAALLAAGDAETVLCVAAGSGYQVLALAVELPYVRFGLASRSPASTLEARALAESWGVENLEFLAPDEWPRGRYDLVALSGIEAAAARGDLEAVRERIEASAGRYLWLLADACSWRQAMGGGRPAEPASASGWLEALLPSALELRGCFRSGVDTDFERRLEGLERREILVHLEELLLAAGEDLAPVPLGAGGTQAGWGLFLTPCATGPLRKRSKPVAQWVE